ncbi:MAG: hypothetical protein MUE81_21430 [Thermoflexibacter sp.]|jgi:hypothetical protein|nr:hypothetical protein [Thermoflexibacter sp.]
MKSSKFMYLFITIAMISLACGKAVTPSPQPEPEEFIVGNWKLSKITIKADKESYEIPVAPATPISAKFSALGTYTFNENGQDQTAKWKWVEPNKKLEISHTNNTSSIMEISSSSKTEWTYVATQIGLPVSNLTSEQETVIQFANLFLTALGKNWEKETATAKNVQILFTMKPL